MPTNLTPAFITLHGNQLEALRHEVFAWIRNNPLGPLEEETFLVQSNGVADWLKIALAEETGICAATRVTLPARFLWQAYRTVLGGDTVAARSPLDRAPLVWRLMGLLPGVVGQEGFEPLRHFLADDDPQRLLQLASRVADLFDQYQVYRADWLADWAQDKDVLRAPGGSTIDLASDQRWQARLWRALLADVPAGSGVGRGAMHDQFIAALPGDTVANARLPRRVILFGISALPYQAVQALAALATHIQVIVAVPNPCQYYWADVISGAELLRAANRRQPHRHGKDLSSLPPEQLHAQCHPLLSGWGRMGRDFVRMLDEFDDARASSSVGALRVDLFSEGAGESMLAQLQADIREMQPVPAPDARRAHEPADRSIEFHIAHSIQREVEILHDRLLGVLAGEPAFPADGTSGPAHPALPLRPRDIVVMVPDIEVFTPSILAVFGQHGDKDSRRIPFAIADVSMRRRSPIVVALDWLLGLPRHRCLQTEVRDLLDVPALAARFGIDAADLPTLAQWVEESAIRWGLDHAHRDSLGLGPAGEQNAWIFGVRRMLMGYACGNEAGPGDIAPYAEVGGLDAGLAGALARFVESLVAWRSALCVNATPQAWGMQARALVTAFFKPGEDADRAVLSQLEQALSRWLDDCALAGFAQAVPVSVLREAWLQGVDEPTLDQRFVSGGVTFCTMIPMRAVPYRMLCLLGMNEGAFPRQAQRADFDLLATPGMARPGDRSRRDDDRYLMLEAILSARDRLYISWVGRNVRDNSSEPPSVLVAQLRDCLHACWNLPEDGLATAYPMQPFSRQYFEVPAQADGTAGQAAGGRSRPRTYASEWLPAHADARPACAPLPAWKRDAAVPINLHELARFLKQPVDHFYRRRLQVDFGWRSRAVGNDEAIGFDNLELHQLTKLLLKDDGDHETPEQVREHLGRRAAALAREGLLPVGLLGAAIQRELVDDVEPVRRAWLSLHRDYPVACDPVPVTLLVHGDVLLNDWIANLHAPAAEGPGRFWLDQTASRILDTSGKTQREAINNERATRQEGLAHARPLEHLPNPKKLIDGWLRQLAAGAAGEIATGKIVARDAVVTLHPVPTPVAAAMLDEIVACWKAGHATVLPVACETALALLQEKSLLDAYEGGFRPGSGECKHSPALARHWADVAALTAEADWPAWAGRLYQPLLDWITAYVDADLHAVNAEVPA